MDGVIVGEGGRSFGWALYLLGSKPVYTYNLLDLKRTRLAGTDALAPGKHTIEDDTFNIGSSGNAPVDDKDYRVPFPFTGSINKVTIAVDPPVLSPADIKKLQGAHAPPLTRNHQYATFKRSTNGGCPYLDFEMWGIRKTRTAVHGLRCDTLP